MLLNWFEPDLSSVLIEMLLLFGLALVISSMGLYRVVYFISIGHAFSIVAMAVITPLKQLDNLTWASALQNIFPVLWGLRLGSYLVRREFRASYHPELSNVQPRSAGMSWVTIALIWLSVSVLFPFVPVYDLKNVRVIFGVTGVAQQL